MIEEQYGSNSVEVANELQKLSDVIMCDIRTMETAPSKLVVDIFSLVTTEIYMKRIFCAKSILVAEKSWIMLMQS